MRVLQRRSPDMKGRCHQTLMSMEVRGAIGIKGRHGVRVKALDGSVRLLMRMLRREYNAVVRQVVATCLHNG